MAVDAQDSVTLAVVVSRLEDMKEAQERYESRMMTEIQGLRSELRASHEDTVSRGEWGQRNAYVDGKFDGQTEAMASMKDNLSQQISGVKTDLGREVAEVKQELAAKKSPPAVWISLAVSAAVALWAFFGQVAPSGTGAEDSDTPHVVEQT